MCVCLRADKESKHVEMADEAYFIGEAPSSDSYLRMEKILDVAQKNQCEAIHPGYGFLSENEQFAVECEKRGIRFIGPNVEAIRTMGSKSESKKIMERASVPVVPGYHGDNQSLNHLKQEAKRIGFPILIKAVMGGGGKGMRIVHSENTLESNLQSAQREALSSFGDSRVILEKYVQRPRHIEFQVFADTFGNVVHLYERDCSVQRRYQKIIEEAPAPGLSQAMRHKMGQSAINAAKAVNYVGAGTVEFIVDMATFDPVQNTFEYYFMEMNTRLQVEHPVTEMITRLDLVEWQLRVASNQCLPIVCQDDIHMVGHSFETRIYAENPDNDFLPGSGHLHFLSNPTNIKNFVRVETGVRQGDHVTVFYDPMISKLVVWSNNRNDALQLLLHNLDHYLVGGLKTNIPFLKRILVHDEFVKGNVETNFIEDHKASLFHTSSVEFDPMHLVLASLSMVLSQNTNKSICVNDPFDSISFPFRMNHQLERTIQFDTTHNEQPQNEDKSQLESIVSVKFLRDGHFELRCRDQSFSVDSAHIESQQNNHSVRAFINGSKVKFNVSFNEKDNEATLFFKGDTVTLKYKNADLGTNTSASSNLTSKSPMPGKVIQVLVKEGDTVTKGQTVAIIEAMKMEHTIVSELDATISEVRASNGEMVDGDQILITYVKDE